ncbi:hypothetical protein KTS45_07985 [Halomicroarcula limicola]|uniref:Uncharacterized protein n=1 Tax=Haloarcula limicola TaxID=1429915 RepID=A0A8J7Y9F5_9EURY|nr:hypothetical protein [Halomicroarcula limicola]MBV0924144.1 hypothetical protein [Halomicroarcula limicola]
MPEMASPKGDDGDWTTRHARTRPREKRPVADYDPEDGWDVRHAETDRD